MNTIYKPKGAAAEYGDYAVNIYTGCPHRCYYCFAPNVLHREREVFHSCVEPRKDIVAELLHQGQPAGGNGESVMDWTPLYITTPADRETGPVTPSDSGGGRMATRP